MVAVAFVLICSFIASCKLWFSMVCTMAPVKWTAIMRGEAELPLDPVYGGGGVATESQLLSRSNSNLPVTGIFKSPQ